MKIYLAVGHGLKPDGTHDPGAVGNGWDEQKAGDHIVATVAARLEKAGHTVKHEAFSDDPNFAGTDDAANDWGADYVLAVHHDWSGSPLGAHGFYYSDSSDAKPFGQTILTVLEEAGFPVSWSWFKDRPELGLLRNTKMPAFLLEAGKIGDTHLDSVEELVKFGHYVADGVLEALPGDSESPNPHEVEPAGEGWRYQAAYEWASELGLPTDSPRDDVQRDEFYALLRWYHIAVVKALSGEVAKLERTVAAFPQPQPVAVDEADIAERVEQRIRTSLKESL